MLASPPAFAAPFRVQSDGTPTEGKVDCLAGLGHRWRNVPKEPTRNTVAKKRAGWEAVRVGSCTWFLLATLMVPC